MVFDSVITNNAEQLAVLVPKKKNSLVVLEKSENSFLVPFCKDSTKEFFEKLFAAKGPFWSAYSELGLGVPPEQDAYVVFLDSQMYVNRTLFSEQVFSAGVRKKFTLKQEVLIETIPLSPDTVLRAICTPFDIVSQTKDHMVAAFRANEVFDDFKEVVEQSRLFYRTYADAKKFDSTVYVLSLQKAVESMKYSFFASLAHTLKFQPTKKTNESMIDILEFDGEKIITHMGFFSPSPYDISIPRYSERQGAPKEYFIPKEPWLKLREQAKLVCARYLAIQRKMLLLLGKESGFDDSVFFLRSEEVSLIATKKDEVRKGLLVRSMKFESAKELYPNRVVFTNNAWSFLDDHTNIMKGLSVGSKKKAFGPVVWIHSPLDLKKNCEGKIIVTDFFSPDLVVAYHGAFGIVSSVGGALSHPAIVAREKDLPCIVQATGLANLKEGFLIDVDGVSGTISVKIAATDFPNA